MYPIVLLALMLLAASGGAWFSRVPPALPARVAASPAEEPLRRLARKVFELANRQRRLHGLHPFEWSDALAEQASEQSRRMMDGGFFSHTDPLRGTLAARLKAAGIGWRRCGENIFRGQGLDDPAGAAVEGWMNSPHHRETLLDPVLSLTGVGVAITRDTQYLITEVFIRPSQW